MKNLKLKSIVIIAFMVSVSNFTYAQHDHSKQDMKHTENKTEQQNYVIGSQVPNELVCMVNDAYMGKPQIPVPVDGKTYYGCCKMCVGTLNEKESARTGIDPFSNRPVDKTEAYIVLMKEEGEVAYFESKENYLNYKNKNK
ncbi:hypothetical protein [Maribacter sp. 4G9]|uniref:hypothetical protein n=1 Tax=Maribacter sp. 4G9 TaxID=1889777 RepID=UPI000C14A273|nr:hypothetical protein [Maribacter sp. 4G9]PIB38571.1 hypothetical protein BFP75_14920 [Maribacter sp. 4G9]|tara:strand:- start:70 stop:492 length:423 start_codon:yes stop_codon:yes gene_type:complete